MSASDPNAAIGGRVYALTVLAAIRPECRARVRAALRALPRRRSPFADVEGTHFARLVIVDELVGQPALGRQFLLFSVVFDGLTAEDRDAYAERVCKAAPPVVDGVLACCYGQPSANDPEGFAAWLAARQIETLAFYFGADATVAEVRDALALRERVRAFARETQYAAAPELRDRFRRAFPAVAP